MRVFVMASTNAIYKSLFEELSKHYQNDTWVYIDNKKDFILDKLQDLNPTYIFLPHWSFIIPSSIFDEFKCVVFHMTDLPYGRGGSPLQNLIIRGHTETKLTAIKVAEGIDTGDIYLKENLLLDGKASDIFLRASELIGNMIITIINNNPIPRPQKGAVTKFERRNPSQSSIENVNTLSNIYNYIRMLDAPGYPNAFLETEHLKIEFTNANYSNPDEIIANVRIIKK